MIEPESTLPGYELVSTSGDTVSVIIATIAATAILLGILAGGRARNIAYLCTFSIVFFSFVFWMAALIGSIQMSVVAWLRLSGVVAMLSFVVIQMVTLNDSEEGGARV